MSTTPAAEKAAVGRDATHRVVGMKRERAFFKWLARRNAFPSCRVLASCRHRELLLREKAQHVGMRRWRNAESVRGNARRWRAPGRHR